MKNQLISAPKGAFSKWLASLIASLTIVALGLSAGEAGASPPQEITITQHVSRTGPNSFVLAGAINDAGSVTLDSVLATAIPSPVVGTAHYVRTYHGTLGTFTLQLQTLITPTDVPWLWIETGHWIIIDGTGVYEGLHGEGEELGVRDFSTNSLDAVFTGQVH